MSNESIFEKTSPVKLFFLAAIPGGISMLAASLYGILDGIFIGQLLGDNAFAALNLAFPFVIINFSLADLIGVGSSVPISIHLGKKEDKEANNIFTCACLMIFITGTVMGAAIYFAAPWLLSLVGAKGDLADLAVQYMRVYAITSPVTTIVFAMDNYLRICGKIKKSMFLNILMSVLSISFEILFLGVLKFGIWGAALASCGGMFICALIAFYPFLRGKLQLKLCRPKFSASMLKQIVFSGSPTFLSNIAGRIAAVFMNIMLLRFGGAAAVSIYGVMMYTGETVQSFLYGVCDSLQPAVGYNWGAGRLERVKAIEKCCFTASAVISLMSAALIALFPSQITSLFTQNTSAEFVSAAVLAMRLFSLTFITRWFSFAVQSYMTAVDKPVYASLLSVCTALVFPLLLLAAFYPLKLNGLWLNFPATYLLTAVTAAVILLLFKRSLMPAKNND